jgi:LPXTG-motif cell wall-anchored protein
VNTAVSDADVQAALAFTGRSNIPIIAIGIAMVVAGGILAWRGRAS